MNVANFEAGAVAGKSSRSQSVETALVGKLGKRVDLVHELRKLRRAEKFFYSRDNRLGRNQVLRLNHVVFFEAHSFFGDALHSGKGSLDLVCHQFAYGTDAAVAQVVDVVAAFFANVNFDEELHRIGDVVLRQSVLLERRIVVKLFVELVAANASQVVAARREEH